MFGLFDSRTTSASAHEASLGPVAATSSRSLRFRLGISRSEVEDGVEFKRRGSSGVCDMVCVREGGSATSPWLSSGLGWAAEGL
jgi:hypothetical protein